MAGHSAVHGDRFTMVKGACSSLAKGAKYQYYPINPPSTGQAASYNQDQPSYDFFELPYRNGNTYWQTINDLHTARNKTERVKLVTKTGISRLPLCAASEAFIHPNKASKFGAMVAQAMSTLPPSFCGPVRDPFLKRNSQYKIYEWMALLHWYIIPIGLELEFHPQVLANFADFVEAVEIAMTIRPRTKEEIGNLFSLIVEFLEEYEKIYVGDDPEKISRCRLCIFQLIHVPQHILWNGSVRLGSQATVERAIGEAGRKIRSKKAPFTNLANNIHEREMVKLLALQIPSLDSPKQAPTPSKTRVFSKVKIQKKYSASDEQLEQHLQWGKVSFRNKSTLNSRLSEMRSEVAGRSTRFFELHNIHDNSIPSFGEALAFYTVASVPDTEEELLVVYHPVTEVQQVLRRWQGRWSDTICTARVSSIQSIVGIWVGQQTNRVHILRKHPGVDLLNEMERGNQDLEGDETDTEHADGMDTM
ncbi:hypothetical protein FIBSPDRAFT_914023 [Athelia psychrophila]|uniref:Uncharacterized protein n=1 Tax=Athelia psychrophila TaxID=1759441 RepID=A0A165YLE1_9AGAM|nr:hypothetical protein FIBSPDRAFT_914023 [Fibularhizoctonia sp. CBS 109695]